MNRGAKQVASVHDALMFLKYDLKILQAQRLYVLTSSSGVPLSELEKENHRAQFPRCITFCGLLSRGCCGRDGTPRKRADQFCETPITDERIPVAREWQHVVELPGTQPAPLNAAIEEEKWGPSDRLI